MSLFTRLLETYEIIKKGNGIVPLDKKGNLDTRRALLPLFHTTFKSEICVTLDSRGYLLNVERDNEGITIIIPCSEESSSRTSGVSAHPLCDQLSYIDATIDAEKHKIYLNGLCAWKGENTKLNAIYTFLTERSLIEEMSTKDLFKTSEIDDENHVDFGKVSKIGVRFSVQIPGDNTPNVWEDEGIRELWIRHQADNMNSLSDFDYISGNPIVNMANSHPKNLNSLTGNAKIISTNHDSRDDYTYRGRFVTSSEALLIDSFVSQKMHSALKWLINNCGQAHDTQVTIVWAVGNELSNIVKPELSSIDFFADMKDYENDSSIISSISTEVDTSYSEIVSKVLMGYCESDRMMMHEKKVVVAIFDAATTGRMGVTFYNELGKNQYLESIAKWHKETSWTFSRFSTEHKKSFYYQGCPSFKDIMEAVYGKAKTPTNPDKGYLVLVKKMQKQLFECMFGNFTFPKNIVDMAARRASTPMSFSINDYYHDTNEWQKSVNVSCALTRKYLMNSLKEEYRMELEEKRTDRDYLYGRLLAIAEKIEASVIYDKNDKDSHKRPTNAVKLMCMFVNKPFVTWGIINKQIYPYRVQLNGAYYHQRLIDEIMSLFKEGEFEDNSPLSPVYLLGYSAQRRALYKSNKEE